MRYEIQTIKDKAARDGVHYRITDGESDSRIATCYDKRNAQLIIDALNEYEPANRPQEPLRECELCGWPTRQRIRTKAEADQFCLDTGSPICGECLK